MLQVFEQKKNYSMIGKVLCKTKPDVASEIEELIAAGEEIDHSKIFSFFAKFDMVKPLEVDLVTQRRIFITMMLKLYYPVALTKGLFILKKAFRKNIATCFGCHGTAITRNSRECVVLYKAYQDFRIQVDHLLEKVKDAA